MYQLLCFLFPLALLAVAVLPTTSHDQDPDPQLEGRAVSFHQVYQYSVYSFHYN
jgi:hypothetical protein